LIDEGVVPFHHPCAGRVVSTVNVPGLAGFSEMVPGLLVTLQSPKLPPPPDAELELPAVEPDPPAVELDPPAAEPPEPELQAATVSASASVAVRTGGRLRFMDGLVFRGTRE
jgi:hypothetical protein